jgi:hypothetical protein
VTKAQAVIDQIKAGQPAELREAMERLVNEDVAQRRAGGPWKLYLRIYGRTMRLHWSYPTKDAAEQALAPMFPRVRRDAEIRHEG